MTELYFYWFMSICEEQLEENTGSNKILSFVSSYSEITYNKLNVIFNSIPISCKYLDGLGLKSQPRDKYHKVLVNSCSSYLVGAGLKS